MGDSDYQSLREKLELEQWPSIYMYKFIFKGNNKKIALIEKEFDEKAQVDIKTSSGGKYVSITAKELTNSAKEVIEKYKAIAKIDGVIML